MKAQRPQVPALLTAKTHSVRAVVTLARLSLRCLPSFCPVT